MYKEKSNENFKAANSLMKQKLYDPMAHCAYYSGFLLAKYVLNEYCDINYEQQRTESKSKDSHFFVINSLGEWIGKDDSRRLMKADCYTYFDKLKRYRKTADYEVDKLSKEKAQDACKTISQLRSLLKTLFNFQL